MTARRTVVIRSAIAISLLACTVMLALVGTDVLRWRTADANARVGLAVGSTDPAIFEPSTLLPVGVSRWLLAAGDDVAFGRALQSWSVVKYQPFSGPAARSAVGRAELALERMSSSHDLPAAARADAIVLHAIVVLEELGVQATTNTIDTAINRTAAEFRRAIAVDPTNVYAKYDLEVVLRSLPPTNQSAPRGGSPPLKGGTKGVRGGAGSGGTGNGGGGF